MVPRAFMLTAGTVLLAAALVAPALARADGVDDALQGLGDTAAQTLGQGVGAAGPAADTALGAANDQAQHALDAVGAVVSLADVEANNAVGLANGDAQAALGQVPPAVQAASDGANAGLGKVQPATDILGGYAERRVDSVPLLDESPLQASVGVVSDPLGSAFGLGSASVIVGTELDQVQLGNVVIVDITPPQPGTVLPPDGVSGFVTVTGGHAVSWALDQAADTTETSKEVLVLFGLPAL